MYSSDNPVSHIELKKNMFIVWWCMQVHLQKKKKKKAEVFIILYQDIMLDETQQSRSLLFKYPALMASFYVIQ